MLVFALILQSQTKSEWPLSACLACTLSQAVEVPFFLFKDFEEPPVKGTGALESPNPWGVSGLCTAASVTQGLCREDIGRGERTSDIFCFPERVSPRNLPFMCRKTGATCGGAGGAQGPYWFP